MRLAGFVLVGMLASQAAWGAKPVTLAQLEKAVQQARQKSDADAAWVLADLEATERVGQATLARLQADLPGEQSRQALFTLAEASQFLDPAAAETLQQPAPGIAEQRRIMGLVVTYVAKTIPQLPNFMATRRTTRYEETPQFESLEGSVRYRPLHQVDAVAAVIVYRDGKEMLNGNVDRTAKQQRLDQGLSTAGLFGPFLASVVVDAGRSSLAWGRWEQSAAGALAVFRFAVPKEKSHYEVNYCCVVDEAASKAANVRPFRQIVPYHGEMIVDPATGVVQRLTVIAELKPTDPVTKSGIFVDYGPVEIGGKMYNCPIKSVTRMVAQSLQLEGRYKYAMANQLQPLRTLQNVVAFEQYHIFRSEARVLAENDPAGAPAAPGSLSGAQSGSSDDFVAETTSEGSAPATTPAQLEPQAHSASATATASKLDGEPSAAPPETGGGPTAMHPAGGTETTASSTVPAPKPEPAPASGFTLRTTTRLVEIPLVAFDKKGRRIKDLSEAEIEIYDNGRKQQMRSFNPLDMGTPELPSAQVTAAASSAPQPAQAVGQSSSEVPGQRPTAVSGNSTVLMIDGANVAYSDLSYAREEMLRFLTSSAPDLRVGLYVLHRLKYEVLAEPTSDHAQIAAMLRHWMPNVQDLSRAQEEEQHNRQQIEFVHSLADLLQVNGNGADPESAASGKDVTSLMAQAPDAKLRNLGGNPSDFALLSLVAVARHLGGIPGHKSLVWVASDNVLADWTNSTGPKNERGGNNIDPIAMRAEEALNNAHVSIYPLDASQLEAGGISADIGTRNVLVVGRSDRDQAYAPLGDAAPSMKPGRASAAMQQDLHPIRGEFRELAAATGGRTLRRASDIATELDGIVQDGRAGYLLSFTPDQAPDDSYHLLTVKLTGHREIMLRYRTGYFYSKVQPGSRGAR